MPDMEHLSIEEQNAIEKLKERFEGKLPSQVLKEDEYLFYRFSKARDFNVDKAEKMLTKYIDWRKIYQVDTIVETFKPREVFVKLIEPNLIGLDKDGDIVRYSAGGRLNTPEIMKCFKMHNYMKHWIWFSEKNETLVKQQSKKTGKLAYINIIMDLDRLDFVSATSRASAEVFLGFAHLLQNNYPERMKSFYVINAPAYYVFIYSLVKAVLSDASLKKIHVFGYSGWKEKLLEFIDADVLPAFLGGNRTDHDGDSYCKSFIAFPGKILDNYYLPMAERYFRDMSEVNTFEIGPSEKKQLFVYVKDAGHEIQWKFLVKNKKTIGFGLFFEQSVKERKEIIPIHIYDTSDGTEEYSYKCLSSGKYIIIFDNSFSRFSTKEIQYIVSVEKPEV